MYIETSSLREDQENNTKDILSAKEQEVYMGGSNDD